LSEQMVEQLNISGLFDSHNVHNLESIGIVDLMESYGLDVKSMGRSAREDELFNEMSAAAARLVLKGQ